MLKELHYIGKKLFLWFLSCALLTLVFFSFGIKSIVLFGNNFLIPIPTTVHSFSSMLFKKITTDLVPNGVELLVISPLTAFLAQVKVAFFLAFFISFPFLLYTIIAYVRPALYKNEKNEFMKILLPSIALFLG